MDYTTKTVADSLMKMDSLNLLFSKNQIYDILKLRSFKGYEKLNEINLDKFQEHLKTFEKSYDESRSTLTFWSKENSFVVQCEIFDFSGYFPTNGVPPHVVISKYINEYVVKILIKITEEYISNENNFQTNL